MSDTELEDLRAKVARVESLVAGWQEWADEANAAPAAVRGSLSQCAESIRAALTKDCTNQGGAMSDTKTHACESCPDCIHREDGVGCCGCYDGVCCKGKPWPFGAESAARLVAHVAWPNDSQVNEWGPRVLLDERGEPCDSTIARARQRFEQAVAAVEAGRVG